VPPHSITERLGFARVGPRVPEFRHCFRLVEDNDPSVTRAMPFAEPATTLTDYALAVVSLAFAVAIARSMTADTRVTAWFWCAAFAAASVAGFTGGTFHGARASVEAGTEGLLWNVAVASMGACGAFITAGIHAAHVRWRDGTVQWLASGIAVTVGGAAVQRGLLPSPAGLDRNVTFHLIQIAALYLFFRCARTVRDRPGTAPGSSTLAG
jgi:hypothetical protein